MTLLDTPLGREAVEAAQVESRCDDFSLTREEAEAVLTQGVV